MYRAASASCCPACANPLVTLKTALPSMACLACGGAWLTNESAVHVMQGAGDAYDGEVSRVTEEVGARASVAPRVDVAGRPCPTCAQPMAPIVVAGTTVDSCPAHGTWFDRAEVARVANACKSLREDQNAEPGVTVEGVAEGAGAILVGSAKLAGSMAVSLVRALCWLADDDRNCCDDGYYYHSHHHHHHHRW